MNIWWPMSVALVGAQIAIAVAGLVGLFLPLANPAGLWLHKKRALLLGAGVCASILPLLYFSQLAAEESVALYASHLVASLVWLVVQILLFFAEDRRARDARSERFDSRSRRSPVK